MKAKHQSVLLATVAALLLGVASTALAARTPAFDAHLARSERARGRSLQRVSALLLAKRVLTSTERGALEALGVDFSVPGRSAAELGRVYGVRIARAALDSVAEHPAVQLVDSGDWSAPPPLWSPAPHNDDTHDWNGLKAAWLARDADGQFVRGTGQVIALIDTGVDVFHPLFFRADAGVYAWVDKNADGQLTPGIDEVDVDGARAVLHTLGGGLLQQGPGGFRTPDELVLTRGWLYADLNGNGVRDFGASAGFDDATPAFGEPVFAIDDVDGNEQVGEFERLVRLGSSKIVALDQVAQGDSYVRGTNLSAAPVPPPSVLHGTGTLGILVGGTPFLTSACGVAPDADVYVIDQYGPGANFDEDAANQLLLAGVSAAQQVGATVLVHEYGGHIAQFADGSSAWEVVLDELSADGMVQVTATHNFAGYQGIGQWTIEPGATLEIPVDVYWPEIDYPISAMYLTLRHRTDGDNAVSYSLRTPDGESYPFDSQTQVGDFYLQGATGTSPRGTHLSWLAWYSAGGPSIPPGEYVVVATNEHDAPVEVWGSSISDTGYPVGLRFTTGVTDDGSMAWPSTADSAISVGAYLGNGPDPTDEVGDLQFYSGRGPRIDGALGVDVVSPADPWTAAPLIEQGPGFVWRFSGTSGALPSVAGSVALLQQLEPEWGPEAIAERVRETASDSDVPVRLPDWGWGHGRLRTDRMLGTLEAEELTAPTVQLDVPPPAEAGSAVDLDASATTDPDGLTEGLLFRWDFDYDGIWDEEGLGLATVTRVYESVGGWPGKLRVEDSTGDFSEVIFVVRALPDAPDPGPGSDPDPNSDPDVGEGDAGESGAEEGGGLQGSADELPRPASGVSSGGCGTAPLGSGSVAAFCLLFGFVVGVARRRRRGAFEGDPM